MVKLYLAGPLFTLAERAFNRMLADAIIAADPTVDVWLPQERARLFLGRPDQNKAIFDDCLAGVRQAESVVAILDGPDVDSGTAVEVGYAHALGKRVLGLRTDLRASEERGINLMLAFIPEDYVLDTEATVGSLAARVIAFCREPRVVSPVVV